MKTPMKLSTVMASALLAIGMSIGGCSSGGLAGRPGLNEEASFGTTQGSRSSESEWQLAIPSATWESDNEE